MPKVELHIHLEGSIGPRTLLALAERNRIPLAATDEAQMADFYAYKDFLGFLKVFEACVACLRSPDDVYQMAHELLADSHRQNVLYREVFFSPQHYVRPNMPYEAILEAINQARRDARRDWGVEMNMLLDISREMGVPAAELATERAIAGLGQGVIGLGIGGDELNFPAPWFAHCFEKGRAAGLRINAHAGEADGPHSIAAAIESLKAERIGHGVRIVEDPALVERVKELGVTLEMCPSSNVLTRVVDSFEAHPLPQLLRAGLNVTVNSDDPPMFNTDLTTEFVRSVDAFALSRDEVRRLSENAIAATFLPRAEQAALRARFDAEWARTESATTLAEA